MLYVVYRSFAHQVYLKSQCFGTASIYGFHSCVWYFSNGHRTQLRISEPRNLELSEDWKLQEPHVLQVSVCRPRSLSIYRCNVEAACTVRLCALLSAHRTNNVGNCIFFYFQWINKLYRSKCFAFASTIHNYCGHHLNI